jgi:hypothetical protein
VGSGCGAAAPTIEGMSLNAALAITFAAVGGACLAWRAIVVSAGLVTTAARRLARRSSGA